MYVGWSSETPFVFLTFVGHHHFLYYYLQKWPENLVWINCTVVIKPFPPYPQKSDKVCEYPRGDWRVVDLGISERPTHMRANLHEKNDFEVFSWWNREESLKNLLRCLFSEPSRGAKLFQPTVVVLFVCKIMLTNVHLATFRYGQSFYLWFPDGRGPKGAVMDWDPVSIYPFAIRLIHNWTCWLYNFF